MAFNMQQLNELNELSLDNIGSWPRFVKVIFGLIVCVGVAGLFYWLVISTTLTQLTDAREQEEKLRETYRSRVMLAARLEQYQQQQQEMRQQLKELLSRLPSKDETPGLLDDLTFHGVSSGLTIRRIQWQPEKPRDFYVELPIQIEVEGGYHQLGEFVARIAGLPRIITLHNFTIQSRGSDRLAINLNAQTYRYTGKLLEVTQ